MTMDTLMKEMVEYCKVAQTQARRSLKKCDQADWSIIEAHLLLELIKRKEVKC